MDRIQKSIRAVIILGTFVIAFIAVWQYFSPDGDYVVSFDADDASHPSLTITPEGRILSPEKNLQTGISQRRIVADPVYFEVRLPRLFTSVDVELQYRNPGGKNIEMGIVELDEWLFDLKPMELPLIDQARESRWILNTTDTHDTLSSDPSFSTDPDVLADIEPPLSIGRYDSGSDVPIIPFRDPSYSPSSSRVEITAPLRGSHKIATYIKNEELSYKIHWTDINRQFGGDPLTLRLYDEHSNLIDEVIEEDDGVDIPTGEPTSRITTLSSPDLQEGLYYVAVETSDDVILTKIETQQHKIAFKDHVFLAGNEEYSHEIPDIRTSPTQIATTASGVSFTPQHESALQDIVHPSDRSLLHLDTVNAPRWWIGEYSPFDPHRFNVPKNDVFVEGEGWYFLNGMESFALYEERSTDLAQNPSIDDVDILFYPKDYQSPEKMKGGRTFAKQSFDIQATHIDPSNPNILLILSIPGLDHDSSEVYLEKATLTFNKQPLSFSRIISRFR